MKKWSSRELLKILHHDGWYVKRQRGSHLQLVHKVKKSKVTVPYPRQYEASSFRQELTSWRNKMDRYMYPAIFEKGESGGFVVSFPDLPGCITEGDEMSEALHMAREAMELYIYDMEEEKEEIPKPSDPFRLNLPVDAFVSVIEAWMPVVRDEMRNRAVKKTLTIPKWLNDVAVTNNVNFSRVLQTALKEYLGITKRNSEETLKV